MRPSKALVAAGLSLALMAAACSGGDSETVAVDAGTLLSEAAAALPDRSARGRVIFEHPDIGYRAAARFESNADSDLAVTIDYEPGVDPHFPDGGVAELRYAGREAYMRMQGAASARATFGSSVGADGYSAWFEAASESRGNPRFLEGMNGLMCVFPLAVVEVSWDCEPLSWVAAMLATASGASIEGTETVQATPTTRVAFRVPLATVFPASAVDELEKMLESEADSMSRGVYELLSETVEEGIAAEAWVDGSGLVRQLALEDPPGARVTVEFYDFDAEIAVDAPPPDQVAGELPGFWGGGGAGAGVPGPEPPTTTTTYPGPPPGEPQSECPDPDGSSGRVLDFAGRPPMCITPGYQYTAVFDTSEGEMHFDLHTDRTPLTVNNFVVLARWGYYDDTQLFRTDPSIDIIQGGSPHTNSASDPGPGYRIPDEPAFDVDPATGQLTGPYRYEAGQLAMARSAGRDSAGAQFFITTGSDASRLDYQGTYVVFGDADAAGLTVAQSIIGLHVAGSSLGGAPSRPVIVRSVTIEETPVGRLARDFTNAALCTAAGFTWSEESGSCN